MNAEERKGRRNTMAVSCICILSTSHRGTEAQKNTKEVKGIAMNAEKRKGRRNTMAVNRPRSARQAFLRQYSDKNRTPIFNSSFLIFN
jgi:hypothetical protein